MSQDLNASRVSTVSRGPQDSAVVDVGPLPHAITEAPQRIRLSRAKGWRMPPNTVKVDRSTRFGNPFTKSRAIESEYANEATWQAFVVECFRDWIGPSQSGRDWWQGPHSDSRKRAFIEGIVHLRGKNLACWCKPGEPCHADVLLELANADGMGRAPSPPQTATTGPGTPPEPSKEQS